VLRCRGAVPESFGWPVQFLDATESLGCMRSARARPDSSGQWSATLRPAEETLRTGFGRREGVLTGCRRTVSLDGPKAQADGQEDGTIAKATPLTLHRPPGRRRNEEAKVGCCSGRSTLVRRKAHRPRANAPPDTWKPDVNRRPAEKSSFGRSSRHEAERWTVESGR
jgi:hypothetical protein